MKKPKILIAILIGLLFLGGFFFLIPTRDLNSNSVSTLKESNTDLSKRPLSQSLPTLEWNITWGGIRWDYGEKVKIDSANNIVIFGTTYSYPPGGGRKSFIAKFNSLGVYLWHIVFQYCGYSNIGIDSENCIYVVGTNNSDISILKYNENGQSIWNKSWGGEFIDCAYDIAIDLSNNLYITGSTNLDQEDINTEDIVLLKYNAMGDFIYSRIWATPMRDAGFIIALDSTNNIYIGGETRISPEFSGRKFVLVKYDNAGFYQWNKTRDYEGCSDSLAIDKYNDVYVAVHLDEYISLTKYNGLGVEIWSKIWDSQEHDEVRGLTIDSNNNLYLAGAIDINNPPDSDVLLIIYDIFGTAGWNITWQNYKEEEWGSYDTYIDIAYAIAIDHNNDILITGYTEHNIHEGSLEPWSDVILLKYNIPSPQAKEKGGNEEGGKGGGSSRKSIAGYELITLLFILAITSIILVRRKIK